MMPMLATHLKKIVTISYLLLRFINLTAQQKPNIILIMADDMGYSDIGPFGSEIPTPNLDRLAKNGIRMNQFYNTARCCPTRASLMTGLFPHQTGIGHMTEEPGNEAAADWGTAGYRGSLNKNCVTIAEVLGTSGYHTYMTGKWHLGQKGQERWPLQRGFEKYYGILSGAASYFKPQGLRGLTYNNTQLDPPTGDYYTTDAFTDSAIAFMSAQDDQKPFFLYLAYNAPHWPLHAKAEDIKKFENLYNQGWDKLREDRYSRQVQMGITSKNTKLSGRDSTVRAWDNLSPQEQKDVAHRMAVYAAQVSSIDQNIGKILATLDKQGKTNNTLIIFLSDNGACAEPYKELGGGELTDINNVDKWGAISYGVGWANASNTPHRKWKREMEEGGIAAPFIVHWPAGIKTSLQNKILSTPSYLVDIMPTLLEVAGASYPNTFHNNKIYPLEGRSMAPLLKGGSIAQHEYMFWEHEGNEAVRQANWKAVRDRDKKEWELFDLSIDKTEEHNLASKYPDRVKQMTDRWKQWAASHFVFPKRVGQNAGGGNSATKNQNASVTFR